MDVDETSAAPAARRRWLKLVVGVAIAVVLCWLVLRGIDLGQVWLLVRQADPVDLLVGFLLLYLSVVALEALRIFLALRKDGLTFRATDEMVVVGLLVANVLGSLVAADAWRLHKISKLAGPLASKVSRFAAVKIIGILAMFVSLAIWLPFVPNFFERLGNEGVALDAERLPGGWLLLGASGMAVVGALVVAMAAPLRSRFFRSWKTLADGIGELGWRQWAAISAISIAMNFIRAASTSYFIYAMGGDIPLLFPVGLMVMVTVATLIPLTPANLGVREFVFVAGLTMLNQSPELSLTVALLNRLGVTAFGLLGLPAFLRDRTWRSALRRKGSS